MTNKRVHKKKKDTLNRKKWRLQHRNIIKNWPIETAIIEYNNFLNSRGKIEDDIVYYPIPYIVGLEKPLPVSMKFTLGDAQRWLLKYHPSIKLYLTFS